MADVTDDLLGLAAHRDRFLAKVNCESTHGCWEWLAYRNPAGYGQFGVGRKVFLAHRVSYEMFVGKIADGLHLDHLCRNRRCVNPQHLEPVTSAENNKRGISASLTKERARLKSECRNGHPYTDETIYIAKSGKRHCLICGKNRAAIRRATNRAKGLTQSGDTRQRKLRSTALSLKQVMENIR